MLAPARRHAGLGFVPSCCCQRSSHRQTCLRKCITVKDDRSGLAFAFQVPAGCSPHFADAPESLFTGALVVRFDRPLRHYVV